MSKQPFIPKALDARRQWLATFVDGLLNFANGLATKYNVPAATLARLDHGRQWFDWTLATLPVPRKAAASLTAFKDALITSDGALVIPTAPAYGPVPAADNAPIPPEGGIFSLAGSVGNQIKAAHDYDEADGKLLGLEGADAALPDPATTAPNLAGSFVTSGGCVEVDWAKGAFDGVKIEVDRGDGKGFVFLAIDTAPNYVDTVKPAPGAAAVFKYRAIYLLDDAEFGQWSPVVEVAVRG